MVIMGLKKCQEHGLGSYGMYVDPVEAPGEVNWEALLEVLGKFGMPDHFVDMLRRRGDQREDRR